MIEETCSGNLDRPTRIREEAYKAARKVAKRICQKKKRQFANDHILLVQEKFTQNEAREAYRELNFFRKGFKPTSSMCRRTDGSITAEKSEVKNRRRMEGVFQGVI